MALPTHAKTALDDCQISEALLCTQFRLAGRNCLLFSIDTELPKLDAGGRVPFLAPSFQSPS